MGGKSNVDITKLYFAQVLASAFGGAAVAEILTIPLDTIKVQMQVYQGKYKGGLHCGQEIIKHEGVAGLFKGLQGGIMRQFFYGSVRIGIYDYLAGQLNQTKGPGERVNMLERIGLGIFSGAFAMMIGNPTDVIKVRFQSDSTKNPRYRNFFHAFRVILKEEGLHGFYQSLAPNVVRNATVNAAEMASYDQIKTTILHKELMSDGMPLHFISSALAGIITTVVASPVDVLKTNIMGGKVLKDGTKVPYASMAEAVKSIYSESGFMGFYKGFNANVQRMISWNIVMFMVREQFLLYFYNKNTK